MALLAVCKHVLQALQLPSDSCLRTGGTGAEFLVVSGWICEDASDSLYLVLISLTLLVLGLSMPFFWLEYRGTLLFWE